MLFFELLNSRKTDKPQKFLIKIKNIWSPKMRFDTSKSVLNYVKVISKFVRKIMANRNFFQQNLKRKAGKILLHFFLRLFHCYIKIICLLIFPLLEYTNWSNWNSCSISCGKDGIKARIRNCTNTVEENCINYQEETTCTNPPCCIISYFLFI